MLIGSSLDLRIEFPDEAILDYRVSSVHVANFMLQPYPLRDTVASFIKLNGRSIEEAKVSLAIMHELNIYYIELFTF
jgi:hypothetical protein